jgi:uncharacterized protein YjbJ (UPF0337 family)
MESVMNSDKLEGGLKETTGTVKKAMGNLTGDESKAAEGTLDKLAGAVQKSVGEVKDAIKDVIK